MNYVSNIVLISSVFLLVGCAQDNYTVIPDSDGSKEKMAPDLSACKKESAHKYLDSQNKESISDGQIIGAVAGGVIAGGAGGAVMGILLKKDDPNVMKKSEVNPLVEDCMYNKGYEGTSN